MKLKTLLLSVIFSVINIQAQHTETPSPIIFICDASGFYVGTNARQDQNGNHLRCLNLNCK